MMTSLYSKALFSTGTFIAVFLSVATVAHAEIGPYIPIVGLPGLPEEGAEDIPMYINQVYLLVIGIGALAGVLRIAWAGVKYSLSDVVTDKHAAKHDIQGVLLGLAILLIPFIVLSTINPNLVNLNVLKEVKKMNLDKSAQMSQPALPNPTVDAIEGKDQPAYIDCMASGKKWDSSNDICSNEQVRDPKVACESYGRKWEGKCSTPSAQTLSVAYLKNVNDIGVLTETWTAQCKNMGNYKLNVVDDSGNNIIFQCIPN